MERKVELLQQRLGVDLDSGDDDLEPSAGGPPLRVRLQKYAGSKGSDVIYGGDWITAAFEGKGFKLAQDSSWDVLWTHSSQKKMLNSSVLAQRTRGRRRLHNQCDYFTAAGQKCHLARHIDSVRTALRSRFNASRYLPTYELKNPRSFAAWQGASYLQPHISWILKPCAAGRSQGIRILSAQEVADSSRLTWDVAQPFIDPYMGFGGRKFHLRLYMLVTGWSPLGMFLYDEGLIFRSRHAYDKARRSVRDDVFSAISDTVETLTLRSLWDQLGAAASELVWSEIKSILAEVLGNQLEHSFGDPGELTGMKAKGYDCFDIFGVDVMIDANLQPFLLEINFGPNMWIEGEGETRRVLEKVKRPFVDRVLAWVSQRLWRALPNQTAARELERAVLVNFSRVI